MSMDPIVLVPYDPRWPVRFRELASPIRGAMGSVAVRIDHIGSTAIPTMCAKPVIDIQVSVESLEPFSRIREPLESLGFRWRSHNSDRTKRYFREAEGAPRTHIHVRVLGSWQQLLPLLFRDYLRVSREDRDAYGRVKLALAEEFRDNRIRYVDGKDPIIWEILRRATKWVQATGWETGPSDA
jgi:GrpB-like predicted nucleotidyltransferase (UPF0157 family)